MKHMKNDLNKKDIGSNRDHTCIFAAHHQGSQLARNLLSDLREYKCKNS